MYALLELVGELFLPERFDVPGGAGVLPFVNAVRRFTLAFDNDVDSRSRELPDGVNIGGLQAARLAPLVANRWNDALVSHCPGH